MEPKRTFGEFITSGSSIASAPVEKEAFAQIVSSINEQFGLNFEFREDAFQLFQDRIRLVAGRFWEETQAIDRKSISIHLTKLAGAVRHVRHQLAPVRGGLHE